MLVLSRKRNEQVVIHDEDLDAATLLLRRVLDTPRDDLGPVEHDVEQFLLRMRRRTEEPTKVTVADIRGDKTRLGFDGPAPVKFWRGEVWEDMERDRREKKSA